MKAAHAGMTLIELIVAVAILSVVAAVAYSMVQLTHKQTRAVQNMERLVGVGDAVASELSSLLSQAGAGVDRYANCTGLTDGGACAPFATWKCQQPRVVFADDYQFMFVADLDRDEVNIDTFDPLYDAEVQLMSPSAFPGRLYYFFLRGPNGTSSTRCDEPFVHPGYTGGVPADDSFGDGNELTGRGCDGRWYTTDDLAGGYLYLAEAGPDAIWGTGDEAIVRPGPDGRWNTGDDLTGAGSDGTWFSDDDLTGPGPDPGEPTPIFGPPSGGCGVVVSQRDGSGQNFDRSGAETILVTLDRNGDGQVSADDRCSQTNPTLYELGLRINGGPFKSLTGCAVVGPEAWPDGTLPKPLFQYWLREDIDGSGSIAGAEEYDVNQNGVVDSRALFGDIGSCSGCTAGNNRLEQGEIERLVLGRDGQLGGPTVDAVQGLPDEMNGHATQPRKLTSVPWFYREQIATVEVTMTLAAEEREPNYGHPTYGQDYPFRTYQVRFLAPMIGLRMPGVVGVEP